MLLIGLYANEGLEYLPENPAFELEFKNPIHSDIVWVSGTLGRWGEGGVTSLQIKIDDSTIDIPASALNIPGSACLVDIASSRLVSEIMEDGQPNYNLLIRIYEVGQRDSSILLILSFSRKGLADAELQIKEQDSMAVRRLQWHPQRGEYMPLNNKAIQSE